VDTVDELFERLPIEVVNLNADVARRAAALRAKHPALRLRDALVIATAEHGCADRLITTDRRWPTARRLGLPITITVL
jgi:predicted nucleic acid-binding protein